MTSPQSKSRYYYFKRYGDRHDGHITRVVCYLCMMADADGYAKDARSSLNRLRARGKYDYATIHTIIDESPILHVSFNSVTSDDPFPVILPMLGATGSLSAQAGAPAAGPRSLYLHGHASSRLMKLPSHSLEGEGTPICVSATKMDGLVLAYAPFHNSCNYRSAVIFGFANQFTDEEERMYALTLITDNLLPGRWDDSRNPPTKAEMTSTGILRVDIVSASAKIREGSTSEDRNDLKDDALRAIVWTGVLPSYTVWGSPIPSFGNIAPKLPPYIQHFILDENGKSSREALPAVENGSKSK